MIDKDVKIFGWSDEETIELVEELNRKRKLALKYSENTPHELSKQIETYAEMLGILGDLYSQAVYRFKKSYADRKQKAGTIVKTTTGTVREKEAEADSSTYNQRMKEAQHEAEMERWKYAFDALREVINAKKKTHEGLMSHYYGVMK